MTVRGGRPHLCDIEREPSPPHSTLAIPFHKTPLRPPSGSARGLGLCASRLLAALGANLYLADVDTDRLKAAAEGLSQDVPG